MPGLDPGIHGFLIAPSKLVDPRVKPGDDERGGMTKEEMAARFQ
jgi:hypothetical protein